VLWTVAVLIVAAGALAAGACAVQSCTGAQELANELRVAHAAVGKRWDLLRAAVRETSHHPPAGRVARPGRTIGGAGSAAQRG
jgi:hypothetical protein